MKAPLNLQDSYLKLLKDERTPVVIYLMNGVQLRGLVCGFDNFTILLDSDGKQEMIYKHAVSTISPQRDVRLKLD